MTTNFGARLLITSSIFHENRAIISGQAEIIVIEENKAESRLKIEIQGIEELSSPFWIPTDEAVDEDKNVDPEKVIRWLLRQMNKYFNGQQNE